MKIVPYVESSTLKLKLNSGRRLDNEYIDIRKILEEGWTVKNIEIQKIVEEGWMVNY